MTEPFILVQYRCEACGVDWREVPVRERRAVVDGGQPEDIVDWVKWVVGDAINRDRIAQGKCHCERCDIKIPVSEEQMLGKGARQ